MRSGISKKERKIKEAQERQAAYDKLTPQQKLEALDELFGIDNGATKTRLKLTKELSNNIPEVLFEEPAEPGQSKKKRK